MNPLLAFYRDAGRDHRGRTLDEILRRDDDWLERTHDFVQWLFPLREPSGANPFAPLVDDEIRDAFDADAAMRARLLASLDRMLAFYGLVRSADGIVKSPDWPARKRNWFLCSTHNDLRITRILKSLSLLGLREWAERLLGCLETLRVAEPDCGIGATAFGYWRDALRRPS